VVVKNYYQGSVCTRVSEVEGMELDKLGVVVAGLGLSGKLLYPQIPIMPLRAAKIQFPLSRLREGMWGWEGLCEHLCPVITQSLLV